MNKKISILLDYHYHFYFIDELVEKMQTDFDVEIYKWDPQNEKGRLESISDKDVIFCEWSADNAVWYSKNKLPHQKLIIRLHRWELFTKHFFYINWDHVDAIIFIAPEIEKLAKQRLATYYSINENNFDREYYVNNNVEFFEETVSFSNSWKHYNDMLETTGKVPNFNLLKINKTIETNSKNNSVLSSLKVFCKSTLWKNGNIFNSKKVRTDWYNGIDIKSKSYLISNYVKSSMFVDTKKTPDSKYNLGMMGIVPKIKRLDIAIDIIHYLVKIDKRYKLYVLSKTIEDVPWLMSNSSEAKYYERTKQKIEDLGLSENIVFEKFTDKPELWMQKIRYLLSVSDIEGSHQAVAEAMANGTIPFIYGKALKFYKLDKIYPKDYCFYEDEINNLCNKITSYTHDEKIRNKASSNCKKYATNNFSIDHIYNQIRPLLLPIQNYSFYTTTNVSIA